MSRYRSGYRFERRVAEALVSAGYVVVRSGGSRGPADLVALKKGRRPLMIACSTRTVRPVARKSLVDAARLAGATAAVARRRRGGIQLDYLDG